MHVHQLTEALHNQLVRPDNELQTIFVIVCLCDVLTEGVPCTARRDTPTVPVCVYV